MKKDNIVLIGMPGVGKSTVDVYKRQPYTRKLMSPTNHHLAAAYYNDGVKNTCKIRKVL